MNKGRIIVSYPLGLAKKASNLTASAITVVKSVAGNQAAPVLVPDSVYTDRLKACATCGYWNEAGNLGMGECKHADCGCTKGKHRLAALACPLPTPKWGAYAHNSISP